MRGLFLLCLQPTDTLKGCKTQQTLTQIKKTRKSSWFEIFFYGPGWEVFLESYEVVHLSPCEAELSPGGPLWPCLCLWPPGRMPLGGMDSSEEHARLLLGLQSLGWTLRMNLHPPRGHPPALLHASPHPIPARRHKAVRCLPRSAQFGADGGGPQWY